MFGPVFLTVAVIGYICALIFFKTRTSTSLIQGGRTWEKGSLEAKSRALAFTVLFVLIIMGTALGVEALVQLI